MLYSAKSAKSKPLSLHQLKQYVEAENNLQPFELVSTPVNRKAIERTKKAERIEQLYQQARKEVAAKINLHREGLLNPLHNG